MLRVQYHRYGGPEELRLEAVEPNTPDRGEIRVRVEAAAANPMDWKIRSGAVRAMTGSRFPRGVGNDFAGVVEAVGPEVTRLKVGDEVFGAATMREAGSFAESLVTEETNAGLKPRSFSFEQAAALPIVGATAWIALVDKAKLQAGQSVFIGGCLGGVGRAAVQIARLCGAEVTGSCSASGREEAEALGVHQVLDYRAFDTSRFRRRFDVVFDTSGALSLRQCGAMLKRRGVALHIVLTPVKMARIQLSPRHQAVFGQPTAQVLAELAKAAAQDRLVPVIGRTAPLSNAIAALEELELTGLPKGKLIIVPGQ